MTATTVTDVGRIPELGHDEAMDLAATEMARLLDVVDGLAPADWLLPTDCTGWTVRDVVGHLLGMWELQADRAEAGRQIGVAAQRARASGRLRIDELTALQVAEHAGLTTGELVAQMTRLAPAALAARRGTTPEFRSAPYDPEIPGEPVWTLGHLFDVIHTRDPWMHRVDICRATGSVPDLTPEHDGRLVADVVATWAARHGQPFVLRLDGPAGGSYRAGDGGPVLTLDAVEFCRTLSGRRAGHGLLAVPVPF
jgi:uncharacterized protein (TIGR03083 family)